MAWLYLVTNSLLVVGDCYAAKPSAQTPNNGGVGFGLEGEHQQVLKKINKEMVVAGLS